MATKESEQAEITDDVARPARKRVTNIAKNRTGDTPFIASDLLEHAPFGDIPERSYRPVPVLSPVEAPTGHCTAEMVAERAQGRQVHDPSSPDMLPATPAEKPPRLWRACSNRRVEPCEGQEMTEVDRLVFAQVASRRLKVRFATRHSPTRLHFLPAATVRGQSQFARLRCDLHCAKDRIDCVSSAYLSGVPGIIQLNGS
jgi:hypothetical protein